MIQSLKHTFRGTENNIFVLFIIASILKNIFLVTDVCAQNTSSYTGVFLDTNKAVLQGLDKTTARVSTFELSIDERGTFGTLVIRVRACRKRPPTEPPESAAYVEVLDKKIGEEPISLFNGWMFASSPTLNSLEHPVYDVWVLKCTGSRT